MTGISPYDVADELNRMKPGTSTTIDRIVIKDSAFNKRYDPPTDMVLLAREAIWHLADEAKQSRAKQVDLSKQLSAMKRGKS